MISVSSAFSTANAKLQKRPIFLLEIQGYNRAFSNINGLGSFPGLPNGSVVQHAEHIVDFGGLSFAPSTATLTGPNTAGNLLFAFLTFAGNGSPVSIADDAGNTWIPLSTTNGYVWYCVANAWPAGNNVTWDPGNLYNHHNAEFYVVEVPAAYSGFVYGESSGTTPSGVPATVSCTVGSNNVSYQIGAVLGGDTWNIAMVALQAATTNSNGVNLVFFRSVPIGPGSSYPGVVASASDSVLMFAADTTANDWLVSLDDLKATINDLDGSSNLANLVFTVQDRTQQLTADMASFIFEGKQCQLLSGFVGMSVSQFAILFTGVIDVVESENYNLEYKFTVPSKNSKKLSQVIYTTGDDGFPTDSKHPKTLNGHPLDMLVSALQQAGIALSDIDTNKIYYYRDTIFNGLSFVFTLTSAPTAKDFIENELMKPLGMYWRENNLATITISSFYPAMSGNGSYTPPTYPQATETVNTITDVPVEQIADLVDQVTFRFDENGNGFDAETVQTWTTAVNKYGLYGSHIIESKGMRSSFQGYYMAAIISRLIFLRYGGKPIVLDPLPLLWSECILESSDIDAVTLAFLPDRQAGVMGITTKTFEVLDRNWRFMEGICEVKLLEIDLTKFKQHLITPNAEPSYASDTAPNQAKYMYLSDSAGKYSTGAAANTLG